MGGRKMTLGMTSTRVYPDKSHMEISVMGMKMTTVINGNKGIMNQMGRKMPISEKQIKDGRFGDEYDMYHNRKDYQFQFLKEVEIKGQKYDLVYVKKGENWKKLYINKKTGFIEITESVSNQPPAIGLIKTISSDFKIIKGIAFPFKSVSMHKGKVSRSMKMKSVNVNIKVGPKLFEIKK